MKRFIFWSILILTPSIPAGAGLNSEYFKALQNIQEKIPKIKKYAPYILIHAVEKNLDYRIIAAVMWKESRGDRNAFGPLITVYEGKKKAGVDRARCLLQVVPFYHKEKIAGRNIYAVETCVDVGTQILKICLESRGTIYGALKCYNPGAQESYYSEIIGTIEKL